MEKVRPWCGQPSDRGRLMNRTGRLMMRALVLQQYQLTVKAIKGSENVVADLFSRHAVIPGV